MCTIKQKNKEREKMKNIMVKGFVQKLVTSFVVACMLTAGPGAIYAATVVDTDAVSGAAEFTEQDEELTEYIDTTPDEGVIYELGEVSEKARATWKTFDWSVSGKTLKYTNAFWASKKKQINISVSVLPKNKTVYVGIIEPDGNKRFVYATGTVSYTFSLTQTGFYNVYVRNAGATDAQVEGMYAVVD